MLASESSPHIDVISATAEQAPIVANLLELYAHDFSEFQDLQIGENGRFGYPSLPLYWSDPGRYAFLVKMNGELGGVVLVKQGSDVSGNSTVWDMAEFFVLRGCRRRGAGTQVAHEVWRRFPGRWEVRVLESNFLAHSFWERAISMFMGEAIHPVFAEKDGKHWRLFSFDSKAAV